MTLVSVCCSLLFHHRKNTKNFTADSLPLRPAPDARHNHRLLAFCWRLPWLDELNSAAWSFPGAIVSAVPAIAARMEEPPIFLHLLRFTASLVCPLCQQLGYESGSSNRPRGFEVKDFSSDTQCRE